MDELRDLILNRLFEHGDTLQDVPEDVLASAVGILGAVYVDLRTELDVRRYRDQHGGIDITAEQRSIHYGMETTPEDVRLAAELGVKYATRCVCQHVVVFSDSPIAQPKIMPCCEAGGECPECVPEGYEHAVEVFE